MGEGKDFNFIRKSTVSSVELGQPAEENELVMVAG